MKFKRIFSIFISMILFVSMMYMAETTTYAVSNLRGQIIEKCIKDPTYKFTITQYLPDIRISILLGIDQGVIDLDSPKDSIICLLGIDESTFDSYFHSTDTEEILDDFFSLLDDIQSYFGV